jgi:hypothetical protein
MSLRRLSESTQTLYAELHEQTVQAEAEATARDLPDGTFVSKEIKGGIYWYLQRSDGGQKRQKYLGADSPALRSWMERIQEARARSAVDGTERARLCSMLAAGGAAAETATVAKVLALLAASGVFRLGGVLVGTQAFAQIGNLLGVRFDQQALRTQDIDVAQDRGIGIALAQETGPSSVADDLAGSPLEFSAVPELDPRRPSTSYKIRGRDLRVDFLTPLYGPESNEPVFLPSLGVAAVPLRFLDFLLESTIQATVVAGPGVLVNVPDPARYALHKLWLAGQRPVAEQTKAAKDLRQAGGVLEVLVEDRPDDLPPAWESLARRPSALAKVERMLDRLPESIRDAVRASRSSV